MEVFLRCPLDRYGKSCLFLRRPLPTNKASPQRPLLSARQSRRRDLSNLAGGAGLVESPASTGPLASQNSSATMGNSSSGVDATSAGAKVADQLQTMGQDRNSFGVYLLIMLAFMLAMAAVFMVGGCEGWGLLG